MAVATVAAIECWPSRRALIVADDRPSRWRDILGYARRSGPRPGRGGGGRLGSRRFASAIAMRARRSAGGPPMRTSVPARALSNGASRRLTTVDVGRRRASVKTTRAARTAERALLDVAPWRASSWRGFRRSSASRNPSRARVRGGCVSPKGLAPVGARLFGRRHFRHGVDRAACRAVHGAAARGALYGFAPPPQLACVRRGRGRRAVDIYRGRAPLVNGLARAANRCCGIIVVAARAARWCDEPAPGSSPTSSCGGSRRRWSPSDSTSVCRWQ